MDLSLNERLRVTVRVTLRGTAHELLDYRTIELIDHHRLRNFSEITLDSTGRGRWGNYSVDLAAIILDLLTREAQRHRTMGY